MKQSDSNSSRTETIRQKPVQNLNINDLAGVYTEVTPIEQLNDVLNEQGFAICKDFSLSKEEQNSYNEAFWQLMLNLFTRQEDKIIKDKPQTYKNYSKLFPKHSMLVQNFSLGHASFCWDARIKAANIFAKLYDTSTSNLLTSMDGFSFNFAPEDLENHRGKYTGGHWLHTDQSPMKTSRCCIQGFYDVNGCSKEGTDACLVVVKNSHKYHQEFFKSINKSDYKSDWYLLEDKEVNFYLREKQCQILKICPPPGHFVLWDSRTIHMGHNATLPRTEKKNRFVIYVCMLKRDGLSTTELDKRIKAYEEGRMTSHWPYPCKMFPMFPRIYSGQQLPVLNPIIKTKKKEELTTLEKSLVGYY